MRVLAVDDDTIVLDVLRTSLQSCGFDDVSFATSAEQALQLIADAKEPFDSFLLDIMLPGISGIELCAQIREDGAYRASPIIMITASKAHDIMAQAFNAGATDFVSKPFDGLELGTRLNMAAMLSDSLHRERVARDEMAELSGLITDSFEDRFELCDTPSADSILGLENGLLRRHSALYAMTLFSVQIVGADELYERCTPAQYRNAIGCVGRAISEVVDPEAVTFAHAGKGAMVAVASQRERVDLSALEAELRFMLKNSWNAAKTGHQTAPAIKVSKIEEQRLWTGKSAAAAVRSFQGQIVVPVSGKPDAIVAEMPEPCPTMDPDAVDEIMLRVSEQLHFSEA